MSLRTIVVTALVGIAILVAVGLLGVLLFGNRAGSSSAAPAPPAAVEPLPRLAPPVEEAAARGEAPAAPPAAPSP